MHIDPTVYTGRPSDQRIPQEEAIYDKLEELSIPFTRVDHDHADTMEDCLRIESVLGGKICKNLFLCNGVLPAVLRRRRAHGGVSAHHPGLRLRSGAAL